MQDMDDVLECMTPLDGRASPTDDRDIGKTSGYTMKKSAGRDTEALSRGKIWQLGNRAYLLHSGHKVAPYELGIVNFH